MKRRSFLAENKLNGTTEPRFFASFVEAENGCWEWTKAIANNGYGQMHVHSKEDGSSVIMKAHRVSWIIHNGEIAEGLNVCHHCDNRKCVNPSHLFLGTHAENSADMIRKGRGGYHPMAGLTGEANYMAKLTREKIVAIRADNRLQREIAADFGVSRHAIGLIKRRQTWASVP